MKTLLTCVLATSIAFAPSPDLRAQDNYPNKIIRLVVPYSAGGTGDQIGRLVGDKLGELLGQRVLITGAGPIGALCVIAARRAGAAEIVVTDIADTALAYARKVGADKTLNTLAEPESLAAYGADKGHFDVLFEASGAQAALRSALDVVRPGGVLVQLGLGGDMTLPVNMITAKELELRGTFRFTEEFALAVELIGKGLVDVKPLITATVPFDQARDGFELALDRSRSMKVQLAF